MADLLEQGSAWLEEQRTRYLSRPVIYRRGGSSIDVLATVGKTVFREDVGYGISERHEMRDYLILASALVLGGVATLPKAGDQVFETEGENRFVYEVMAPGGEPPWRYSDPYRRTLRIHTKFVGSELVRDLPQPSVRGGGTIHFEGEQAAEGPLSLGGLLDLDGAHSEATFEWLQLSASPTDARIELSNRDSVRAGAACLASPILVLAPELHFSAALRARVKGPCGEPDPLPQSGTLDLEGQAALLLLELAPQTQGEFGLVGMLPGECRVALEAVDPTSAAGCLDAGCAAGLAGAQLEPQSPTELQVVVPLTASAGVSSQAQDAGFRLDLSGIPQSLAELETNPGASPEAPQTASLRGAGKLGALLWEQAALALQPTAYYKLDETAGGVLVDSSGNALHGAYFPQNDVSYVQPSLVPSDGGASLFQVPLPNQTDAQIVAAVPNRPEINPAHQLTVAGWVRSTPDDTGGGIVFFNKGGSPAAVGWALQRPSGASKKLMVRISTTLGILQDILSNADVLRNGVTRFVVVTLDAGVCKIYVDGALDASQAYVHGSGFATAEATSLFVQAGSHTFIDELVLFAGRVLAETEIASLYQAGIRAAGLDLQFGIGAGGMVVPSREDRYIASVAGMGGAVSFSREHRMAKAASGGVSASLSEANPRYSLSAGGLIAAVQDFTTGPMPPAKDITVYTDPGCLASPYGNGNGLHVNLSPTVPNPQFYIGWDLSGLPAAGVITSAKLYLTSKENTFFLPPPVFGINLDLFKLLDSDENWTESMACSNRRNPDGAALQTITSDNAHYETEVAYDLNAACIARLQSRMGVGSVSFLFKANPVGTLMPNVLFYDREMSLFAPGKGPKLEIRYTL